MYIFSFLHHLLKPNLHFAFIFLQCPNPDFNKPEHRWRTLQRSLIEAVVDLLASGGKVIDSEEVLHF
jgi:hypothetical protein